VSESCSLEIGMKLDSARDKIRRAQRHMEEFARLEREFTRAISTPAEATANLDGSTTYRRRSLPEPPVEFSLVAGDCLQNARSALEHAVYALSQQVEPTFERTAFPVCLTPKEFADQRRALRFLPGGHQTFIEAIQPFKMNPGNPKMSPLWRLHDLARIDRHRIIPTLLAVTRAESVERLVRAGAEGAGPDVTFFAEGGTHAGDPLLMVGAHDETTIAHQPNWDLFITFAETGDWIEPLLRPLVGIVAEMIAQMESDSPKWPPGTTSAGQVLLDNDVSRMSGPEQGSD